MDDDAQPADAMTEHDQSSAAGWDGTAGPSGQPLGSAWDSTGAAYSQPPGSAWGSSAAQPGPGWMAPAQQPRTSGLAIASFILGILGFTLLGLVLSVIFGIIALVRTGRGLIRGRGFAIAGLVLSGLWVVVFVVLGVASASHNGSNSSATGAASSSPGSSSAVSGTRVSVFSLVTGDCFDNPTSASGASKSVVSVLQTQCTQPHNAQIFATFTVPGSILSYPGSTKLINDAESGCDARAKTSIDSSKVNNSEGIRFIYPLESSWLSGHHTIACMVVSPSDNLTSSLLKR